MAAIIKFPHQKTDKAKEGLEHRQPWTLVDLSMCKYYY